MHKESMNGYEKVLSMEVREPGTCHSVLGNDRQVAEVGVSRYACDVVRSR